ncbi:hypothetical protein TSAR_013262 [Trichomalopsis sarcophagae]|uniref:Uncharacterized protein n=1 Tax=Trichomalopsis sarcophagae TaxID=543379 RepID=A0A232EFD9_9HYME|nr:hypothetical protein TSAR_013262 [Trichomalopsis sarcophagae]
MASLRSRRAAAPVTLFASILLFEFFMIEKKMLIVTVREFFGLTVFPTKMFVEKPFRFIIS